LDISDFQRRIERLYGDRDRNRGTSTSFLWLTEEMGELAEAVRHGDRTRQVAEMGDVLAWLASIATQLGIDLDESAGRYSDACPRCGRAPCTCQRH